jgi:(p)ppGpp synthase/HD superfamily hydrolase
MTIKKAFEVAEKAHHGQLYGGARYMEHISSSYLVGKNVNLPEEVLIAVILHDVIEDSDMTYNDIKSEFGENVAEIVYAVTDELGKNRKERKEKTLPKIVANPEAIMVKLCDRISHYLYTIQLFEQYGEIDKDRLRMLRMYVKEYDSFITPLLKATEYLNSDYFRSLFDTLYGVNEVGIEIVKTMSASS